MSKYTSSAGRFDGHGGAPEQFRQHCPMHDQGYPESHWTPPSGNYSLCYVSQQPLGQQQIKQQWKNGPTLLAILMAAVVHPYNTARITRWRRSRALVEATVGHHWVSIAANSCNQSHIRLFFEFFHCQLVEKGCELTLRPQLTIGVWHIKQKRRT